MRYASSMEFQRVARRIEDRLFQGIYGISIVLLLVFFSGSSWAGTISLPLSIDYPMLRSLVVQTAFTDADTSAELTDEEHGCWEIRISEPSFTEENGKVRFQTRVYVYAGLFLFNRCILPVEWEGYLRLYQVPKIDDRWTLSFQTVDSAVYDTQLQPATLAGIVWELVRTSVYHYLGSITINLAPPVSDLKEFIGPLFPPELKARAERMVQRMRPGDAVIGPHAVRIDILTDVEDTDEEKRVPAVAALSENELERLLNKWEAWDAYLVYILTSLTDQPLSNHDRDILLDVLLETRYRFVAGLTDHALDNDFVRKQFIESWQKLSPVFRNHLGDDPTQNLLGYLAFFTASDALTALDAIGPTLGVDISRNGLIRLARMLIETNDEIFDYTFGTNRKLRSLFALGSPLAEPDIPFSGETEELEIGASVSNFFISAAWASDTASRTSTQKLMKWVFRKKSDFQAYTERVKSLLTEVIRETLSQNQHSAEYGSRYRQTVLATAWQESCFRQFKQKGNKITFLRSYNGTSVGLMQINERVWRGIYDRNHLRWDIRYNCRAGCEIMELYFQRYALPGLKKNPRADKDEQSVAGLVYAMYNGGPGQFKKYLNRRRTGDYYLTDKLFSTKLAWVARGQWDNLRNCLVGK